MPPVLPAFLVARWLLLLVLLAGVYFFGGFLVPVLAALIVGLASWPLYQRWLPLINHENRQGGILTAKALMKEGGVIACEAGRHPFPAMHAEVRRGLIDIAKLLDPLVLNWSK